GLAYIYGPSRLHATEPVFASCPVAAFSDAVMTRAGRAAVPGTRPVEWAHPRRAIRLEIGGLVKVATGHISKPPPTVRARRGPAANDAKIAPRPAAACAPVSIHDAVAHR